MRAFLTVALLLSTGCYFVEVEAPRRPRHVPEITNGGHADFCPDEYLPSYDEPVICEIQEDSYEPIGECCSWRDPYIDQRAGEICLQTWCLWDDYCGWEYIDSWCLH